MRVLIVDDNLALAENLGEILADEGHQIQVAGDPEGAIRQLEEPVDFALVDICLAGGADGVGLAEELRRRRPGLQLALMTAHSSAARVTHAEELALGPILPKPVPLDVLMGLLAR